MINRIANALHNRKATLTSISALAASQAFSAMLMGVGGLVQARYIDPQVLGRYSAFTILAGYLSILHLGSVIALQREYPYWMGKGVPERARLIASVAQGWAFLLGWIVGGLYLCLALSALLRGYHEAAAAWTAQLAITAPSFYVAYLSSTYRSTNDFVTWSKLTAAGALTGFFMLPVVVLGGFWGLCVRGAVAAVVAAALLHRYRPLRVAPAFEARQFWGLVRFGLPIDLSNHLVYSVLPATLGALVLHRFGLGVLGLLAFARVAETIALQLAGSLSTVFVPRIHQQMGMTENLAHCARYIRRPMLLCITVVLAGILAGSVLCGPAVRMLTPKYEAAVPLIRLFLWAALFPVLNLPTHVLVAAKRNRDIITTHLTAFFTFVALALACIFLNRPYYFLVASYMVARGAGAGMGCLLLWMRVRSSEPRRDSNDDSIPPSAVSTVKDMNELA